MCPVIPGQPLNTKDKGKAQKGLSTTVINYVYTNIPLTKYLHSTLNRQASLLRLSGVPLHAFEQGEGKKEKEKKEEEQITNFAIRRGDEGKRKGRENRRCVLLPLRHTCEICLLIARGV
ncbi:hypothetical protein CDAR_20431 [Caerostris darwini]|uniref:Uncharacterized protein n=1 Tax=Caerostris darwini TaxID=1538125 RepID=A0AAV4QG71_9ARAC|nr:hypothetical protein CDAR_20431 [Caerostris darwini]